MVEALLHLVLYTTPSSSWHGYQTLKSIMLIMTAGLAPQISPLAQEAFLPILDPNSIQVAFFSPFTAKYLNVYVVLSADYFNK